MTDVVERGPWPDSTAEPELPPLVNYEAEQALLAAILADNRTYDQVEDFLAADHFADGAHGRIYAACGSSRRLTALRTACIVS